MLFDLESSIAFDLGTLAFDCLGLADSLIQLLDRLPVTEIGNSESNECDRACHEIPKINDLEQHPGKPGSDYLRHRARQTVTAPDGPDTLPVTKRQKTRRHDGGANEMEDRQAAKRRKQMRR